MKKLPIIFIVFSTFLITESALSATALIYHAPSDYEASSERKAAASSGFYISHDWGELGYEQSTIDYNEWESIHQSDFIAVWKAYTSHTHHLRLGLHYTASDESESDAKITLIAEALDYGQDVYGSAFYYTRYHDDEADVWQLSPKFGRYFWSTRLPGTLYLQTQAHAILVNTRSETENYFSLDLKAHWTIAPWGVELGGWFGEQRSAVTDSGFTVYNLNDRYDGEVRLFTTLNINENTFVKLGGKMSRRITDETRNTSTWVLGFGYTFK